MESSELRLIETLTSFDIFHLIDNAKKSLYISLPGIDAHIADILIKSNKLEITQIIIDNSEETIRNGFGELHPVEALREHNFRVYESDGNLISFIIADGIGYFIFPQSKIFIDEPKGPNAFRLDPISIRLLISSFFPSSSTITEPSSTQILIDESLKYIELISNESKNTQFEKQFHPFNQIKYSEIKRNLEINPSTPPDLQRQINVYTAKIQFVELRFKGGDLENMIVTLPENAIPIQNVELRHLLMTKIRMFQGLDETEDFKIFLSFKEKIAQLRSKYLIPITCRPGKSIIKINQKAPFLKEVQGLREETTDAANRLIDVLEKGRLDTIAMLRQELTAYYNAFPPVSVQRIQDEETKIHKVAEEVNRIIYSIKFPDISNLIDKITLTVLFFDLTWSDFNDKVLLDEFKRKKVVDKDDLESIVRMRNAFESKSGNSN